ncbi:lysophospholipase NTE1 [Coniella lustricola]|uniref:Lysophospholipase NTE1 n=1 Tax=Coniella lustricola TaxID=2025994 RepID=A0A2T2ZTY0_9PEZI|nr:lysophospholipase NTE1 [Coniella lustricola]
MSLIGSAATAASVALTTAAGPADGATTALSSVITRASDVVVAHGSLSWIGIIARLILWILQLLSTIIYYALKLTTISIPTLLFNLFSASLTVTMNATTLMLIVGMVFSGVTWVVRYRYLNMYSRLPPEPQRKEPDVDLFPDTHEAGVKSGLSNYLDEFLSAIKVFGYLERPVFHELTRSMQTRKLIAGETINLEHEQGFCIVVDGLVEIFVKSARDSRRPPKDSTSEIDWDSGSDLEDHHPGRQQYQLLTEVRNGAPMSSLFTIMALFTEDVKLRHSEEDAPRPGVRVSQDGHSRVSSMAKMQDLSDPATPMSDDLSDVQGPGASEPVTGGSLPSVPHMSLYDSLPHGSHGNHHNKRPSLKPGVSSSAHPDIIARASVDTTIAIIPASAFRRLIKIYPKATSHIVHLILSRFQRVTLATAFSYLGLTAEVLQTERNMIKYTMSQLPNHLRGEPLERLKEKFKRERERIGEGEAAKGIALHNSVTASRRRRRSSTGLRKEAVLQAMKGSVVASTIFPPEERSSIDVPSPGDLLANIQQARSGGRASPGSSAQRESISEKSDALFKEGASPLAERTFNPFTSQRISIDKREKIDEENLFRESILECMFKAIGLDSSGTGSRGSNSAEASPRLVSYDQRRQKAVFSNNAFGFMDPFDVSADGDTESVASSSFTAHGPPTAQGLAQDMKQDMEIVFFPKGSVLVEQGERNPGLYYVIDGFLDMCASATDSSGDILQASGEGSSEQPDHFHPPLRRTATSSSMFNMPELGPSGPDLRKKGTAGRKHVALIKPGGLAGYIGTVSSYRSFIDVCAKTDVYLGFLPRASLERIVDKYPIVLLTMAKRLTSLLPRLILHIDFALEWLSVNAGQVIFHDNDESDAIYLVLNGRLRLVEERKEGGVNSRAEFGQGESVGELEVLTETARSGTLHAIRDTEIVKFPRTLFNSLAQEHPSITIKISKMIASKMRSFVNHPSAHKDSWGQSAASKSSSTLNLRTVAILPVTAGVPVVDFGHRLMTALSQVGTRNGATSLNQSAVLNHLGKHAFNKMGKLRLSQYLADLEEKYGLVVYVADTSVNSPWTATCITQADCILLVGLAEGSPEIGEYERFMLGQKSTARKILVMLHGERYSVSGLTRTWLKNRVWINGGHFHVQMNIRAQTLPIHPPAKRLGLNIKERVQTLQAEIQKYTSRKVRYSPVYSPDAPFKGDFHRLARRLCGRSVGLVLGGGGARGIAHVGIIRAMEEAGVPIDIVGGTSIGSFIGGLYARHADVVPIYGLAKKFAGRMASKWRFALDLTYPSASYTTGHEFNRGIFKIFEKTQIEDFWLEFYCNTTNISKSRAEIHTSGYAWRYIRASMSLAGLLPPLCDEGSMLLDGGYVDNLTVSHMKSLGVDTIFAVDVGSLDDDVPQSFGDTLSGAWAFWNRWNPFSSTPNPPTLAEIQARLAYVSSVDALERAKNMEGCLYMRPPIDDYGTLDFGKFDEINEVGYKFGQGFLQQLREKGLLPLKEEAEAKEALRRTMAPRRASI